MQLHAAPGGEIDQGRGEQPQQPAIGGLDEGAVVLEEPDALALVVIELRAEQLQVGQGGAAGGLLGEDTALPGGLGLELAQEDHLALGPVPVLHHLLVELLRPRRELDP